MTKRILEAKIISNEEIADRIYRVVFQNEDAVTDVEPGRFVNVYLRDKSLLLPRPISICFADKDQIALVYRIVGKGTKELSRYRSGESLSISTPLGQGYYIDKMFETLDKENIGDKTIALVAGGLGVPPMLELAKNIRKRLDGKDYNRCRLITVAGFQTDPFLVDELAEYSDEVMVATEDGGAGYKGNVIELMESKELNADYYLACGPKPMLKALTIYCDKKEKPLQVSLEERMGCGYGACVGCTCKTRESIDGTNIVKQKKVCKDGPVFFGNEVVWDE